MQATDENGNNLAPVYTRNTTNSPTHLQSVLLALEALPFERVPTSAYFDKYLFDLSISEPYKIGVERGYLPLLKQRSRLPADCALASPDDENHRIVFIYDLDEITMLSQRYLSEVSVMRPDVDINLLETFITNINEKLGFVSTSTSLTEVVENIKDVFNGEDEALNNLTPKYDAFQNMYNEVSESLNREKSIISEELINRVGQTDNKQEICKVAEKLQKIYNQRWKWVEKCLRIVKERSGKDGKKYANIVISEAGIIESAIELLISQHASYIDIENIYSTRYTSKQSVFDRIQKRFGTKCVLIYITSSLHDAPIPNNYSFSNNATSSHIISVKIPASRSTRIYPIWSVVANESIELLFKAQRDHLLR